MSIKVESYCSTNPAQCFAYQRFGHSSLHCGYQPKCIKCSGSHLAKECKKTPEEKPSCANCKGDHTANFKHCLAFLQVKTTKTHLIPKPKPTTSEKPSIVLYNINLPINVVPTPNSIRNKSSYASKVSNSPSHKDTLQSIAIKLHHLLTSISSGSVNLQEALISTILAIMPLLINNHYG